MKKLSYLLSVVFLLAVSCLSTTTNLTGLEGKKMPELRLLLPDSVELISNELPVADYFLMVYIDPTCHSCKEVIKQIKHSYSKLTFAKIYVISYKPIESLQKFYAEQELYKYQNIMIAQDWKADFANYIGTRTIPITVVCSPNLVLEKVFIGEKGIKELFTSFHN